MELSGLLREQMISEADEVAHDSELVARARQGDEGAWSALVRCHQQPVFRLAYLMLGDARQTAATAEDITQETFLRAFRKLGQFEEGRPLRPWLLAIAANLARNQRRSIGRYWANVRRWWRANREEPAVAHQTQDDRDDAHLLWQAIQRLSPGHQEVLYLRYFLDMPEEEMAETLTVPAGTVKSRLYRARHALKAVLEDEFSVLVEEWQAK
jgi:RNA polymerase sigma-70 factor (ECF subfamily)